MRGGQYDGGHDEPAEHQASNYYHDSGPSGKMINAPSASYQQSGRLQVKQERPSPRGSTRTSIQDRSGHSYVPSPRLESPRNASPSANIAESSHKHNRSSANSPGQRASHRYYEQHHNHPQIEHHDRFEQMANARPFHTSGSSHGSYRDLEKGPYGHHPTSGYQSPRSQIRHSVAHYADSDDLDMEEEAKQHAAWILIYLSALAPLLALIFSLYTCAATLFVLVSSPLCLCFSRIPLRIHLRRLLSPPLTCQLGLIYSSSTALDLAYDHSDPSPSPTSLSASLSSSSSASSSTMLILINIFSPVYACGIMIAAWTAAGFWFFSAILGDPSKSSTDAQPVESMAEKESHDGNDGRSAVIGVSRWWERWLGRGLEKKK